MHGNRPIGFLVVFSAYVAAFLAGMALYYALPGWQLLPRIFAADVLATLVVFGIGVAVGNASVYDPYWSVQPPVILWLVALNGGVWSIGTMLLLAAVSLWAIRLTLNWAYTFQGLSWQDWRYTMLKEKSGPFYPLVNLFGIHLFPTVVVFLAIAPAILYVREGHLSLLTWVGAILAFAAPTIQFFADIDMQNFRRTRSSESEIINTGMWRYSRHPNYLGEILMWWGVFFISFSSPAIGWTFGLGALANTLMFLFISIPMAERRLAACKTGFAEYKARTRLLLPLPTAQKPTSD